MKAYWDERGKTDEFRKNVKDAYNGIIEDSLNMPLEWYLDFGKVLLAKPPVPESWFTTTENVRREWQPLIEEELRRRNKSPSEIASSKTLDAWRKYFSHPPDLERDTVEEIVKQGAIKDLFVTIIHDAIISFNKKFNPFFGAVAALGLDKQIKEFIIPFMDSATDIATDFIVDPANKSKFSDMGVHMVDLISRQKPDVLLQVGKIPNDDDFASLIKTTVCDENVRKFVAEVYGVVADTIKAKHAGKTLGEALKAQGFDHKWPDLDDTDLDYIIRWMNNSPALQKFFDLEAKAYKP